ncbi:MAG: hypothetical protein AAFX50_06160, partial [Acidobacteriota bacterium]
MSGSPAAPGPDGGAGRSDGPGNDPSGDADAAAGAGPDAEPSAEPREGDAPSSRRRLAVVGALAALALVAAASTLLVTWGRNDPSEPLAGLGLGPESAPEPVGSEDAATPSADAEASSSVDPPLDASDPEQLAFLERQQRRAEELAETTDNLEDERGVTLTDRSLVRRLSGRWRLDIGGRQAIAEFAPVVVDRVRRGSLLVELYPVNSRHLPPFYTAFELPDRGTFIAFRAADGDYRLVLEGVRFHGPNLFSYRLGDGGRRQAYRLVGDAPPSLEREEAPESIEAPPRPAGGVAIQVDPVPPAAEMWSRAEALRDADKLHSLRRYLDQILTYYRDHRQARRWRGRVDRWIEKQRNDLVDDVRDRLDDIHDGVGDRDLD